MEMEIIDEALKENHERYKSTFVAKGNITAIVKKFSISSSKFGINFC